MRKPLRSRQATLAHPNWPPTNSTIFIGSPNESQRINKVLIATSVTSYCASREVVT